MIAGNRSLRLPTAAPRRCRSRAGKLRSLRGWLLPSHSLLHPLKENSLPRGRRRTLGTTHSISPKRWRRHRRTQTYTTCSRWQRFRREIHWSVLTISRKPVPMAPEQPISICGSVLHTSVLPESTRRSSSTTPQLARWQAIPDHGQWLVSCSGGRTDATRPKAFLLTTE